MGATVGKLALVATLAIGAAQAAAGDPLRVCTDPASLPVSKAQGSERGARERAPVQSALVVPHTWLKRVATTAQAEAATAVGDPKLGQARFNNICSHCHGSNGASPVSERDLRRMKIRYKDGWREVAAKTIREGRPDLGMPAWAANYSDKEVADFVGFFETIQK